MLIIYNSTCLWKEWNHVTVLGVCIIPSAGPWPGWSQLQPQAVAYTLVIERVSCPGCSLSSVGLASLKGNSCWPAVAAAILRLLLLLTPLAHPQWVWLSYCNKGFIGWASSILLGWGHVILSCSGFERYYYPFGCCNLLPFLPIHCLLSSLFKLIFIIIH